MIEQIVYRRTGGNATAGDPGGLRVTDSTPGASKANSYFQGLYGRLAQLPYNKQLNAEYIHVQEFAREEDMLALSCTRMDPSGSRASRVSHGLLVPGDQQINGVFGMYPLMCDRFVYLPGYQAASRMLALDELANGDADWFARAVRQLNALFARQGEHASSWMAYLFEALMALAKRNMEGRPTQTKILLRLPHQAYDNFSEAARLIAELLYALLPGSLGKWLSYVSYSEEYGDEYDRFDLRFVAPEVPIGEGARRLHVIIDFEDARRNVPQNDALRIAAPSAFSQRLVDCLMKADMAALMALRALLHEPGTAQSGDAPAEVFAQPELLEVQTSLLVKLGLMAADGMNLAELSPDERAELMREYAMALSGRRPLFAAKLHALLIAQIPMLPALLMENMVALPDAETVFGVADQLRAARQPLASAYLSALSAMYDQELSEELVQRLHEYPELEAEIALRALDRRDGGKFDALPAHLRQFLLSYTGTGGGTRADVPALIARAFANGQLSELEQAQLVKQRIGRFLRGEADEAYDMLLAERYADGTLAQEPAAQIDQNEQYADQMVRIALDRRPELTFDSCSPSMRGRLLDWCAAGAEGAVHPRAVELLMGALTDNGHKYMQAVADALNIQMGKTGAIDARILGWFRDSACQGNLPRELIEQDTPMSSWLVEQILRTDGAMEFKSAAKEAVRAGMMRMFERPSEHRPIDALSGQMAAWYESGMAQDEKKRMLSAVRAQKPLWDGMGPVFAAYARQLAMASPSPELVSLLDGQAPEDGALRQRILGAMDASGRLEHMQRGMRSMDMRKAVEYYAECRASGAVSGSALDHALAECAGTWTKKVSAGERMAAYPALRKQLADANLDASTLADIDELAFAGDALSELLAAQERIPQFDDKGFREWIAECNALRDGYIALFQQAGMESRPLYKAMRLNQQCARLRTCLEMDHLSAQMRRCLRMLHQMLRSGAEPQLISYGMFPARLLLDQWQWREDGSRRVEADALDSMAILGVLLHAEVDAAGTMFVDVGKVYRDIQQYWHKIRRRYEDLKTSRACQVPAFVLDLVIGYDDKAKQLVSLTEDNLGYRLNRVPYQAAKIALIITGCAFLASAGYACMELVRML